MVVLGWQSNLKPTHEGAEGAPLGHSCPFSLLGFALNGHQLSELQTSPTQAGWKRSRRRVTCLLFVKARTWSAVSLLPTPQKHKEPFLPVSPFSLTQRQAAGKFDGWWFRFLLWGRPFASDKDYNLAHLTEYKSLKFVFLVTSDYIYIHKKFQTKRHTSKSSPSSYPLPALFPSSETATVIRLFCLSDDIHSSNPTFYRGFLIKRKE